MALATLLAYLLAFVVAAHYGWTGLLVIFAVAGIFHVWHRVKHGYWLS